MEADWEIEVGPHAPVIDGLWTGFVDLRDHPLRVREIDEASRNPALGRALIRLNPNGDLETRRSNFGLWTSKCDLWEADPGDPDEMNATVETSVVNLACYIDLLPLRDLVFETVQEAEQFARGTVKRLGLRSVCCSRADLVIRRAFAGDREGFGVTVYVSACGADGTSAAHALDTALTALADAATS